MYVKRLEEIAKIPTKANKSDAGFDVYAIKDDVIKTGERLQVKLGICIEIAPDNVALMSERSGMAIKYGVTSIGNVIDPGYRGEISIILFNSGKEDFEIKQGDRIGQILLLKLEQSNPTESEVLNSSDRGESAHYSSGK